MHFDPRTQAAFREAGVDDAVIERAADLVVEAVRRDAARLEDFFAEHAVLYSDMDRAHGDSSVQEHPGASLDLYTHAADLRGYVRFDGWGAYVEGGRVLSEEVVELTLGPTVHGRVRFAPDPERL